MNNDIYYRIYVTGDDYVATVCMQWFDEWDYDRDRFFTDEDGERLMFDTEEEALKWLHENVKPDMIHPDDRKATYNQNDYLL